MFYGVLILMFFADNRRHKKPHIHARYQDFEAVISIPEGRVLEGKLPPSKLKLVLAWIEIHHEELMADWALASESQPIFKIDPLK